MGGDSADPFVILAPLGKNVKTHDPKPRPDEIA
jgi:hypothetical protein